MPPAPTADISGEARIPFWRNVKTIGILAQIVFVLLIVAGIGVLVSNVTTALRVANLPADFSFLTQPAGIPIAERPIPYAVTDSYARALLIGFLNTLKVAIIGVVLASLIGVLVGVMRLSSNWLVKSIATVYVELLRNIPLAVQIVFWYAAILLPFPPRISNPISLPGGMLLSNVGLAFPSFYPTYRFGQWLPWLIAAVVLAIAAGIWRKRSLDRRDIVGRVWHYPLITLVAVAGIGYAVASIDRSVPDTLQLEFDSARGRGTVNFVEDGKTQAAAFVPVSVSYPSAQLTTTTQNLVESRRQVNSTFRFPLIRPTEVEEVEVVFAEPEAAEAAGYRLEFDNYPSSGTLYVDANGNDAYDAGEEVNEATGTGFNGVQLVMRLTGFHRVVVGDRDGQVRTPLFRPLEVEGAEEEAAAAAPAAGGRFSAFGQAATERRGAGTTTLEAETELLGVGPLVLSNAHIPVSNYEGGVRFTVNYLALLLALVVYTSAFIGEIVRGGIQAVAKGQREAANALGLSGFQTFSLIVFPQALRIVLPPVISQYLNLTKNSSLATLAGYAELFVIASVVSNQTGAAIPIALLLIGSYLAISLAFSLVLNKVNERLALVER
ncbi:MAG TPA: ABC transporter permease subunit [Trueperaceae bacterium]|nr:ABC transporter permease subunit [Trueperaceae bacterium]